MSAPDSFEHPPMYGCFYLRADLINADDAFEAHDGMVGVPLRDESMTMYPVLLGTWEQVMALGECIAAAALKIENERIKPAPTVTASMSPSFAGTHRGDAA